MKELRIIEFLKNRHADISVLLNNKRLEKGCYFYVNPFNYYMFRSNPRLTADDSWYMVDGSFACRVFNSSIFRKKEKIYRQSFDWTSIAPKVLQYAVDQELTVFIAGGSEKDIEFFVQTMEKTFDHMNIVGYCSGYTDEDELLRLILSSKPQLVILGLGNIKQERVAKRLYGACPAIYFTCGAFISQVSMAGKTEYFPTLIDKLNFRWLYRFIKEPHVILRVVLYYPRFLATLLRDIRANKKV